MKRIKLAEIITAVLILNLFNIKNRNLRLKELKVM